MKLALFIFFTLITLHGNSQVNYGTPPPNSCPDKLETLPRLIDVNHFPKENDPIKIEDTFYWKHATSIFCKSNEVTIIEYGAYLYYNGQWNLRASYPLKELDKTFGTKKQVMRQAEPYTWTKNYRTSDKLFGGWALWYFIGSTQDGTKICGYETIHTTNNLLN